MAGLDAVIGGLQVECHICLPFHVLYQENKIRMYAYVLYISYKHVLLLVFKLISV